MAGVVFDSTFLIDLFNPKVAGDQRESLWFRLNLGKCAFLTQID